jgi:nicotinate-nucleotide--dimethylbenzimidazole phosphoribosyltransferase
MNNLQSLLQNKINQKTKPLGALGRLEELAIQIGSLQQTLSPQLRRPTLLLFAADHGLANEGVSAYPQAVTAQMVLNFVRGGAASTVFARRLGFTVDVIDAGVAHDFDESLPITHAKIAHGTQSGLHSNAMTGIQLDTALAIGALRVQAAAVAGANVIALGEMGIGNTASASLLMASLCGLPVDDCVGRGTGLDDERLAHKRSVLARVFAARGGTSDVMNAMQRFGGFEIAAMTGAMIEANRLNVLVLVDGFIAGAAALAALRIDPAALRACVFAHQSAEHAHQMMLRQLNVKPLLDLGMRLGEGTGALLAYPLVQAAVDMLNEMASFDEAGVSKA